MGTVTGPASSTDNAITRWDGTTGTVVKDSLVLIDDSGNMTGVASLSSDGGDFTSDGSGNVSLVSLTGSPTTTTAPYNDNSTKVATTGYVCNSLFGAINGLDAYVGVRASTLGVINLVATYSNGSSGVGATLTNAGTKQALVIDGVTLNVNDAVLVGSQNSNQFQNGVYVVTTVGDGSTNWVLTRATYYDTPADMNNPGYIVCYEGDSNAWSASQQTASVTTIGTDDVAFSNYGSTASGFLPRYIGADKIIIGHSDGLGYGAPVTGDVTVVYDSGTSSAVTSIVDDVALGGSPTTTTQSPGDNSTKIATTAFVHAAVSGAGTVVYNVISGNLPSSMTGTHTTASMSVSAGQAADSTNSVYITGAGYSWAVSNGNAINGYQGGTTLPNSSTIHMFLCTGASGTGVFASTSLSPTLPTGYSDYYRRIFSFNTNGSGAPIPYTAIESEGGGLVCYLSTQLLDVSTTSLGTSRTLYTLTVPSGIKVQPLIRQMTTTAGAKVLISSPDETDVAPGTYSTVPQYDSDGTSLATFDTPFLTTNTSGQIGARAAVASSALYVTNRGFRDFRRG